MMYQGCEIIPEPPETFFGGWSFDIRIDGELRCFSGWYSSKEVAIERAKGMINKWDVRGK